MDRDFEGLLRSLGGEATYTDAQIEVLNSQLYSVLPKDFTNKQLLKRVDLDGGFSQEIRAYWNDIDSYLFYYAFIHQRDDGVVVLKFEVNTESAKIFGNL